MRVNIWIKLPGKGKRATFRVIKRLKDGKEIKHQTIRHPTLTEINSQFRAGRYSREHAEHLVRRLVKEWKAEYIVPSRGESILSENQEAFQSFWDEIYAHREMKAETERSTYNDFLRAIRLLGNIPLKTASRAQPQAKLDNETHGKPARQRRAVVRLRQLLEYLERDKIALRKKPEPPLKVKYLTEAELKIVLPRIEDTDQRTLIGLSFYSGLRIGEAFAITEESAIDDNALFVFQQMYKDGQMGPTRNRKERDIYLFDEGVPFLKDWLAIST